MAIANVFVFMIRMFFFLIKCRLTDLSAFNSNPPESKDTLFFIRTSLLIWFCFQEVLYLL
jgi:hypothetical protein